MSQNPPYSDEQEHADRRTWVRDRLLSDYDVADAAVRHATEGLLDTQDLWWLYIVYHELLHHLLPNQGHDAEFRDLEAAWPNAVDLNLAFDTLHERWDLASERYV